MYHGGDARAVNSRQAVNFVNQRHALRLVVGATDQVGNSVDDDQMDAPVQVVVLVHALDDGGQPLVPRHPRQAVHVQVRRHFLPTGTPQQPPCVLVELLLALFRVVQQHRTPLSVRFHLHPKKVRVLLPFHNCPGDQRGGIVTLARPFSARDAEYVLFRA